MRSFNGIGSAETYRKLFQMNQSTRLFVAMVFFLGCTVLNADLNRFPTNKKPSLSLIEAIKISENLVESFTGEKDYFVVEGKIFGS